MPKSAGYGRGKGRMGSSHGSHGGGSFSQGMTNGSSVIQGTGRSVNANAPMDSDGGNYGVPVGDTGVHSKKGNRRTYQVADRYK